jgi:hypothetical protein
MLQQSVERRELSQCDAGVHRRACPVSCPHMLVPVIVPHIQQPIRQGSLHVNPGQLQALCNVVAYLFCANWEVGNL